MQLEYRNFGTASNCGRTVLKYIKPEEIQKVAAKSTEREANREKAETYQNDT